MACPPPGQTGIFCDSMWMKHSVGITANDAVVRPSVVGSSGALILVSPCTAGDADVEATSPKDTVDIQRLWRGGPAI